jgi:hypothetical protein
MFAVSAAVYSDTDKEVGKKYPLLFKVSINAILPVNKYA